MTQVGLEALSFVCHSRLVILWNASSVGQMSLFYVKCDH